VVLPVVLPAEFVSALVVTAEELPAPDAPWSMVSRCMMGSSFGKLTVAEPEPEPDPVAIELVSAVMPVTPVAEKPPAPVAVPAAVMAEVAGRGVVSLATWKVSSGSARQGMQEAHQHCSRRHRMR
jgi:hypothetical protein